MGNNAGESDSNRGKGLFSAAKNRTHKARTVKKAFVFAGCIKSACGGMQEFI